jgi:hypothetical protein
MTMSNRYSVRPVSKHARGMHRWMVVDTKTMTAVRFTVTRHEAVRRAEYLEMTPAQREERERLMVANYVAEGLGEI